MSLWDNHIFFSSFGSTDASSDLCGFKGALYSFYELFVWMNKSLFNAQQL